MANLLLACERSVVYRPSDGSAPEALRLPTQGERALLEQRRAALRQLVRPCAYDHRELGLDSAAVAEMVDSFTSTRSLPDRAGLVAGMVTDLQQFPAWAIERACTKVRMGEVQGLSLDFCPGSARMAALIREVLAPVGAEDRRIAAVLRLVQRRTIPTEEAQRVAAKFEDLRARLRAQEPEQPRPQNGNALDRANEVMFHRVGGVGDASPELLARLGGGADQVEANG